MFAGLARLGVPVSAAGARAASHGPLFVLGVFFSADCARASGRFRRAGYVAPILGLVAGLGFVAGLLRYDLARRTLRQHGLPRYAAVAALLGAFWLGCSGVLLAVSGLPVAGPVYDAILHGIFVGFVLSMVFGHAPIILPAVARAPLPFHTVLYSPLLALHAGLVAR